MEREFVLSDQTINSYGFRVLTAGINIDRFLKNPIMLFGHNRDVGVIGRWDNVRKDGERLLGTPVFDTESEMGKTIAGKVAGGFLRAASIGIDDVEMVEIDGVMTVVECTLEEVSIVDIPSNENAVALYNQKEITTLSNVFQASIRGERARLARVLNALGLSEKATDDDISLRLEHITGKARSAYEAISEAESYGVIEPGEKESYLNLAKKYGPDCVTTILGKRLRAKKAAFDADYKNFAEKEWFSRLGAFKSPEIINDPNIKDLAMKDFAVFKKLILSISKPRRIIEMIAGHNGKGFEDRSKWTLDDWRKYDPVGLRKDPILYDKLVATEFKRNK